MQALYPGCQGSGPLSSHLLGLAGYRVTCMLGAAISTTSFLATAVLIHLEVTTFQPVDLDSYSLAILEYLNIIKKILKTYLLLSSDDVVDEKETLNVGASLVSHANPHPG